MAHKTTLMDVFFFFNHSNSPSKCASTFSLSEWEKKECFSATSYVGQMILIDLKYNIQNDTTRWC